MEGTTVSISPTKREISVLVLLLAISFLIRVLLFPLKGYSVDTGDFASWINTATQQGIRTFYSNAGFIDYPPFNIYIFWIFGSLAKAIGISITSAVKLIPNIFDIATATLIYVFVRKQASFKTALLATALYTFNPATIYNTAVWGQFDAIYTFFLVLSLMLALKSKPKLSALAFAIGLLTKPQGIVLAPLLVFLIYKKSGLKNLIYSVLTFTATVFVVILPFQWSNPLTFLSNIYLSAYGEYAVTSVNAFNLWGLYGLWNPDGGLYILGWALFGVAAAFTLYFLYKRYNASNEFLAIFAAFMLFFAFFMLPTRIHERYLFPAISVLALMFPFLKRTRILYAALTATFLVNQAYVLYWLNVSYPNAAPNLTGDPVVLAVSAINLLMFIYASVLMFDELRGHRLIKTEPPPPPPELSQSQVGEGPR